MSVKQTYLHVLLEDQHIRKHALRISRISRNKGIFSMDIRLFQQPKNQTESSVKVRAERKPTSTRFKLSAGLREKEKLYLLNQTQKLFAETNA